MIQQNLLIKYAKYLYKKHGGRVKKGYNPKIKNMMKYITNETLNSKECFKWLNDNFDESFLTQRDKCILKNIPYIGKNFYSSSEWIKLRYKVLRKSNGKCQLCGHSPKEHNIILHVDHIKPKSKYPELALNEDNLQVLCENCNLGKSNTDCIDWR